MTPLDNLTVCVTNFRRPEFLDRCLNSVRVAGCRRVVVASVEPSEEVMKIIDVHRDDGWLTYDVATVKDDIGCNDTWQLAAYHARTRRIIILHDDDMLNAGFGKAYTEIIGPTMDRENCFATWRADLVYTDGSHKPTEFWSGPTRLSKSAELMRFLSKRHQLSLSPVISVLDRQTVIHACKEAAQTLLHPECHLHQGMLLGTEIVVYMRHVQVFSKWLYVDQILSHYGSHDGSGTIAAEKSGDLATLWRGYDRARTQAEGAKPVMKPKIIFTYYDNHTTDPDEIHRNSVARTTWDFQFSQGDMIELPLRLTDLGRTSTDIGDTRCVPYVRDCFDWGVVHAMPEDIVVYCNRDIGLTATAAARILAGVERGRGVTCCPRRWIHPKPGRIYKDLVSCRPDGGFDAFAMTPEWWVKFKMKMPDMLIGREAWDTVFRNLAEEWADNRPRISVITGDPAQWARSKAYTDHVAYHKTHLSNWIAERLTSPGQKLNRSLAYKFFLNRNNMDLVRQLT